MTLRFLPLLLLAAFGLAIAGELDYPLDAPAPDGRRPGGTLSQTLPAPVLGNEENKDLRRETDPYEVYRDAKLAWKLSRAQLAVLRELCAWREQQARARDLPRNRIIREHSLWPLAKTQPDNLAALGKIEDMHPRTVRQDGQFLLDLIKRAGSVSIDQWPPAVAEPLPVDAATLIKQLRALGQAEAERLDMAPELMLRKKTLEALVKSGYPDGPYKLPDSLRGWRRELMGQALLDSLATAGEQP